MWLQLAEKSGCGSKLHHRDVVRLALQRLERDLSNGRDEEILTDLQREIRKS